MMKNEWEAFLNRFRTYGEENGWKLSEKKTLLAVSGGVDSVMMTHLFSESAYPAGIAHVNFRLRGEEAEQDAAFVKELAQKKGLPFFCTSYATRQEAERLGISIQVAARKFRYQWLEEIRRKEAFHYIATAHQLDDSIETFFFNLSNGCGLRGLHGIRSENGPVIRPLLWANKEELEQFAQSRAIDFRLDRSNLEEKYARNFIRHRIIPDFQKLNPSFQNAMQRTIRRIRETEALYDEAMDALKKKWFREENGIIRIERQKLSAHPASLTILHEWISPFGFSPAQLEQMLSEQTAVGALFHSSSHLLTVDRSQFQLVPLSEEQAPDHYLIEKQDFSLDLPDGKLQIDYPDSFPVSLKTPPDEILLDRDKLAFPLLLRRWKPGDLFHPFGMKGKRQKVKDYFINEKLSRIEKQKVWLLTSDGKICWVVGYRADERFSLDKESQGAVRIRWEKG